MSAQAIIDSTLRLRKKLAHLQFSPPVAWVYRPLEYAWQPHRQYLERYGKGKKSVLFLGMNPGPFGMAQSGIPFGEIAAVRDWMKIEASVDKPANEHPKRPIDGFGCQRSEVSGRRLWGLFANRFPAAENFFQNHFVLNFCPLVWMSESGANLTPDKLPSSEMAPVEEACLLHLSEVIDAMRPKFLVGIGAFAEMRLTRALALSGHRGIVGRILHPSPASPAATRGWAEAASRP
ncbi:MAG: uracil-DNA glycosylase family protein, partial [Luteolibacter sp.]